LRESYLISARLGAVPLRDAVADLARRARVDVEPTDPTPPATMAAAAPPDDPAGGPEAVTLTARFGLSAREIEVLRLVGQGQSNAEIGHTLYISPKTASVHVSNILRKLGVTSRVQAAAIAHRTGLLDQPGDAL
jgi:DNA-binding CsgD family transcriptional regulator